MPLESVNFISDLNSSNPADADLEAQGAAHLRNIKKALLNTFPGANRTVGIQRIATKTTSYAILQTDSLTTFLVDTTSGLVTLTLPNLGQSDSGWEVQIIKLNAGANPIIITPTSGVLTSGGISSLSATRRCIPGVPTRVIWTGSGFFCTRAGAAPVASVIEYDGAVLPTGFEWPNGQTLSSATNYPDYVAVMGTLATFDRREFVAAGSVLGLSSPGRLTAAISGVTSTVVGSNGGTEGSALSLGQLPSHAHPAFIRDPKHAHTVNGLANPGGFSVAPGGVSAPSPGPVGVGTTSEFTGVRVNSASGGGGTDDVTGSVGSATPPPVVATQPTIIKNFILVVE